MIRPASVERRPSIGNSKLHPLVIGIDLGLLLVVLPEHIVPRGRVFLPYHGANLHRRTGAALVQWAILEDKRAIGAKTMAITEKSQAIMSVSIFQRLYDSEINFEVSCFWDAGFDVRSATQ
jgi:hypothetical protein